MSCQPVDVQAPEPVAPCTRWQFEAIAAPIVKLAKAIVKANDPERRGEDCPEPLTGADTFEIREAILAHAEAFAYWWAVGEGMQRSVVDYDDAKIAPMFLATHKARMERNDRGEADPNDHPTVCAARSHLQASMIHADYHAILERTPFKALVLASGKGKTNLRVDFEDMSWYADALKLRTVVRTLDSLRCRDWRVRIDWNLGWNGRMPNLTFTWGAKGRLRVPMTYDEPWRTYPTVSFKADRTVGRPSEAVTPRWPVRIEPAGVVPANETARVACEKAEQPMSETNTKATAPTTPAPVAAAPSPSGNPLIEADLHKWSLAAGPDKKGQAWVTIYAKGPTADKPAPIGKGKGATIVEAYANAVKSIGTSEF